MIKPQNTLEHKLALSHNDHSGLYSFHAVNTTGLTILGLSTCTDMKLVTLNYSQQHASTDNPNQAGNSEAKANLLTQYADCFEGIGCFTEASIILPWTQ
jgi:hypothetical protein